MNDFLQMIVSRIRDDLTIEKRRFPLEELKRRVSDCPYKIRDFKSALKTTGSKPRVIAELKKASPSKGLIREDFCVQELALGLERGGAVALSVLTERHYFSGDPDYLNLLRRSVRIPLLRKDFILDEYQVFQSRLLGADAILLIAALLTARQFLDLYGLARTLGLHVLAEAHSEQELAFLTEETPAEIIGMNCRDLKSFHTNLNDAETLLSKIPSNFVRVAESGISSPDDLSRIDADAFLIGETLMRAESPEAKLRELLGDGKK